MQNYHWFISCSPVYPFEAPHCRTPHAPPFPRASLPSLAFIYQALVFVRELHPPTMIIMQVIDVVPRLLRAGAG
jgi:hypothetical protein